jgi:CheY-like chemotaxis protein
MISFFSTAGYGTTWVKTPAELLSAAGTQRPHVILIRIILPHSSGPALAAELAATSATRGVPVILYGDSGLHKPDQKFANVERFVPSCSPVDLLKAIAAILGVSLAH